MSASTLPQEGAVDIDHAVDFSDWVAARQHVLLRTAYVLTGNPHDARDLLQTALAKAYLSWGRLREPRAAEAYVRRIMVNEHISWWRRAWRTRENPTADLPEPRGGRADPAAQSAERDELWTLVQTLPTRQRAAVVLRYYEDLSEAETAQLLGCSVGTVKSQTSRAVARLRARLAAEQTTGETL